MFGMYFMVTQYLEISIGLSALGAGLIFLVSCVPQGATGVVCARLIARFSLIHVLVGGLVATTVGLALIAWGMHASLPVMLVGMTLMGIGQGAAFGPLTSVGIWGIDHADAGAAYGLVNTVHQMGGTMGIAALAGVAGASASYSVPMVVAAVLSALALGTTAVIARLIARRRPAAL